MPTRTLDYLENIEIDDEKFPLKNLHAVDYLTEGIFLLVDLVKKEEAKQDKGLAFRMFSDYGLMANYFNWFAVSVTSYIRIVATVDYINNNGLSIMDLKNKTHVKLMKEYSDEYLRKVVPELYKWRDKLAAHFAITDPRDSDNIATLEYSLMQPVTFSASHFRVGDYQWNTEDQSSSLPSWSLMETFENQLVRRYWPYNYQNK